MRAVLEVVDLALTLPGSMSHSLFLFDEGEPVAVCFLSQSEDVRLLYFLRLSRLSTSLQFVFLSLCARSHRLQSLRVHASACIAQFLSVVNLLLYYYFLVCFFFANWSNAKAEVTLPATRGC